MRRKTPFIRLFSLLALFLSARLLSAQDINAFFDDTSMQDVWLQVDPADWASLQQNYLDDTYYPATFSWNNITLNIGIRSHGNGSRSPIKPNLDLKFDKYVKKQLFLGEELVIAKAGNQDPSLMHEDISFQLFRQMGLPAPRLSHARLYLNGQFFGLYLMEEHQDETYVQRNLGESTGYLYEWSPVQYYNFDNLGPDGSAYSQFLDLKTDQAAPDLQNFADFVQVINNTSLSDADYITALSKYINPKLFVAHAATENVLAELDGMFGGVDGVNNFYLYQYANTTFYQVLTWDKDLTFWDAPRDIFYGMDVNHVTARLQKIPEYKMAYVAAVAKAIALFGGTGGWADQEISREYALIHDTALMDVNKQCIQTSGGLAPCGVAEFEAEVTRLHAFTGQRESAVDTQLISINYQPLESAPFISSVAVDAPNGSTNLAPGALFSLQGRNFGDSENAQSAPLPRALGNVFVAVEGIRAALSSSSSGTITAQFPYDLPLGTVNVTVAVDGVVSNNFQATVQAASPAVLAITHANGLPVNAASPIVPGETITIYATGLGIVSPSIDPGAAADPSQTFTTVNTPNVTIDSTPLYVAFAGLTPGFVGLDQINAQVPLNLASAGSLTVGQSGAVSTVTLGY